MVEDEEAKDLIADLFLDIWEKRESLSIHSSVSAYLHTALKNKAINSRKRKDRNICIDEEELSNLQADSFTSPARFLMAKEFDKQIQHYIDRKRDVLGKSVFVRIDFGGCSIITTKNRIKQLN